MSRPRPVLRHRRAVRARARARRPPPLARADDAAPPARARRAARAALPGAQDPRAASPTTTDGATRARSGAFLRRLRPLALIVVAASSRAGTIGLVADRGPRASGSASIWALDIVATVGSIPAPRPSAGQIVKVAPDRAGRRYALLRPGDGDGGLRRRPPRRPARRAPDPARPSTPPATTTSSAASAASAARSPATCAPPGARYVVIDAHPENREQAAGVGVRFIEGEATDDEVLRAAGIDARARGHRLRRLRRRQHLHHADRARAAPGHRDRRARRVRGRPRPSCCAPGATRVISPYKSSGSEMARLALQPAGRRARSRSRPSTAWRRSRWRAGCEGDGPADRRRPRRCDHRRACAPPTARSSPSRPPRPCSTPATS